MIVAAFPDAEALQGAARALRGAGLQVETRTPIALPEDEHGPSRIPRVIFGMALAGFAGAFGMQCYATMVSYPQLIGGRPNFFWTSFLVYAVESGVLAATTTGVAAFLLSNRLPRYWEPSDEHDALRDATRDGWFLVAEDPDARRLLHGLGATSIDQVPA